MLMLNRKESRRKQRLVIGLTVAVFLLSAALYVSSLFLAPVIAPLLFTKPIDVGSLSAPSSKNDRIVIPRIGVNASFTQDSNALEHGAQWRSPKNGNPEDGGNFVIAARRFSLQATPLATIKQSLFYNLSKLSSGDKVIIDYKGKRYGYEIYKSFTINPSEVEIEAQTTDPTLTLYSVDDNSNDRLVIQAKRLGEIAVN